MISIIYNLSFSKSIIIFLKINKNQVIFYLFQYILLGYIYVLLF